MQWEIFWTQQFPVEIHGTPRRQLIDADEFGIYKNSANRK
jgi:hypothetical protein